jgi:hypothetical protein
MFLDDYVGVMSYLCHYVRPLVDKFFFVTTLCLIALCQGQREQIQKQLISSVSLSLAIYDIISSLLSNDNESEFAMDRESWDIEDAHDGSLSGLL